MALDIEKLVKIGGKEWQKGDMHRVYFDSLPEWYGLKLYYYNSGHVCGAELNGETISHAEGNRIFARLTGSVRFWYDVNDKIYHAAGMSREDFEIIREKIRAAYHAL